MKLKPIITRGWLYILISVIKCSIKVKYKIIMLEQNFQRIVSSCKNVKVRIRKCKLHPIVKFEIRDSDPDLSAKYLDPQHWLLAA
jgi:hypothetical protein